MDTEFQKFLGEMAYLHAASVQRLTVSRLNNLSPEHVGRVRAEAVDAAATGRCQDDTDHGPATVALTIGGELFELCGACGARAVDDQVRDPHGTDLIDVEVYRG